MSSLPDNPGGYVYGTILVAALLAIEAAKHETYGRISLRVGMAIVLYWLAISYAEYVGHRADDRGHHFSLRGFADVALHELAVLVGALGPLLAILLCWATGAPLSTGLQIAVFSAAGIIVATEVALGIRSHLSGVDLVIQTAFGVVFGLIIIAMRVLVH